MDKNMKRHHCLIPTPTITTTSQNSHRFPVARRPCGGPVSYFWARQPPIRRLPWPRIGPMLACLEALRLRRPQAFCPEPHWPCGWHGIWPPLDPPLSCPPMWRSTCTTSPNSNENNHYPNPLYQPRLPVKQPWPWRNLSRPWRPNSWRDPCTFWDWMSAIDPCTAVGPIDGTPWFKQDYPPFCSPAWPASCPVMALVVCGINRDDTLGMSGLTT